MTIRFNELPSFAKEFRRLAKKYKSLPADLEEFKHILSSLPLGTNKHFNVITKNEQCVVLKARFFCRYLKGSSLRIIYGYKEKTASIDFIEIYFKGEKESEDRNKICEYLESI
ncbi:MAG: hypothetical protein ACD_62C00169G0019 [uncultured bacterium]|nr:MAG: hypothetical protein ACD_62C00169G0019 [uncultured bacterium]